MNQTVLRALIPLSLIMLSAVAMGCSEAPVEAKEEAPVLTPVATVTVQKAPFSTFYSLTGEAEAERIIEVAAEAGGRVTAVELTEGDAVAKDGLVARVDGSIDRTRIRQIRTRLSQAQRDLTRAENLQKQGVGTPSDVEQAKVQVDSLALDLRIAQQNVGKTTVKARAAGIVDDVMVEEGEYVNVGTPIVKVVDYDRIKVHTGIPESYLRYVKRGSKVHVRVNALDLEREATVARVGVQGDTKNRSFPLEVEVDNGDLAIRPGMRVSVQVPLESYTDATIVPRRALIKTLKGSDVAVVKDGVIERRAVKLGKGRGRWVHVLEGLSAGDELVVTGQRLVGAGESVNVVETGTCCAEDAAALTKVW